MPSGRHAMQEEVPVILGVDFVTYRTVMCSKMRGIKREKEACSGEIDIWCCEKLLKFFRDPAMYYHCDIPSIEVYSRTL